MRCRKSFACTMRITRPLEIRWPVLVSVSFFYDVLGATTHDRDEGEAEDRVLQLR